MSSKAQETKAKINPGDYIKIKSFCIAKEIMNITNRQPTERGKIFGNETPEKGLIPKIYKEFIQFNTKKKKLIQLKDEKKALTDISPKKI